MVDRFYPLWTAEPLMCFWFFPSGFLIFCHVFSMFIGPRCPWSDLCVRMSVTPRGFAYLTDVTLADEDTNSILTDNANRAIGQSKEMHCNVAIQVTQPGGQLWKQCKWR